MNGRDRYLIRMFIRSVRVWRISYVMSSIFSLSDDKLVRAKYYFTNIS